MLLGVIKEFEESDPRKPVAEEGNEGQRASYVHNGLHIHSVREQCYTIACLPVVEMLVRCISQLCIMR